MNCSVRSAPLPLFGCLFAGITLNSSLALASAPTKTADLRQQLEPFLADTCQNCHDASEKKGGLDLESLPWTPEDPENQRRWTQVFDKLHSGEMPPPEKGPT
jgi:hypothetical protein